MLGRNASLSKAVFVILVLLSPLLATAQISDAALKTQVETEYPVVKYATNDWVRIQALREFSYKHTAAANNATVRSYQAGASEVTNLMNGGTGAPTLGDAYAFFDNYGGGVVCGGTGQMLQKLYQLYGYDHTRGAGYNDPFAFVIGFDPPTPSGSTFTHVQTLLDITRDGKIFHTVNDADQNLSYALADGRGPIDYYDMVWLLGQNKSKYISYSGTSSAFDAKLSTTNGAAFNIDPPPPNNTQLYFNADINGYVSGRIDFPLAISTIDLDVTSFNGGTVTMTAYDTIGNQAGQIATQSGQNHLSISASAIKYVLLTGNNQGAPIKISNLQVKIINPVINFTNAQGFTSTDPSATNGVAAKMDASFSTTNGTGFSVYPAPPSSTQLYFNADGTGNVRGRIDFPKAVSTVDLDVVYFNGGTVTMYAYDKAGNLIGQVSGTDQAGHNHLSISANIVTGSLIQFVLLNGNNQGAAINITNLQTKIISPTINFSSAQGFGSASGFNNDPQHYINGAVDGSKNSPNTNTVGFCSDEPTAPIGWTVDKFNSTPVPFYPTGTCIASNPNDKWVYKSPRTIARLEALGDQAGSWKDQLKTEGRPGETIYLHTFQTNSSSPIVLRAKQILNDFKTIKFTNAEGFTSSDATAINNVAAKWDASFSDSAGFSVYPAPPNSTQLYFNADGNNSNYVTGRIDFPTPISAIDLDVTYFAGGTVILYAYDTANNLLKQVQGTDQPGSNHLGITADSGTTIGHVILFGRQNGAAINFTNLQLRTLGPTIRFTYADGFTSSAASDINTVAGRRNASFSTLNGAGFSVYPAPPNNTQLYFNADASGNVTGQINFTSPVSAVDLDVVYFNGGKVTMTAYDSSGNSLGQVQGTDQSGTGLDRLNHLAIAGNPGSSSPIAYVKLTGNAGGAAINIKNLQTFNWQ